MKSLAIAIAAGVLLAGASVVVAQTGTTSGSAATTATPMAPSNNSSGTAAATGSGNQAVATTGTNASNPAKGANSFTMGEARSRIEKNGFSNVSDLVKDDDGIWRGKAQKGSSSASVWLDYKGNVGATN